MEKLLKYGKWVFVGVVVVAILLLAPTLTKLTPQQILSYTPSSPLLAALVLIGIYCAKSVLMIIPTYGLYAVAGILFPPGVAILVGYIGLACEMCLGYGLGMWLGRDKVHELVNKNEKMRKFVGFLSGNTQMVCFWTRLLPMPYPVDLGSMFFAAAGLSFWRHLLFSLLGFSAVMIPITLAGGNLSNPLSAEFLLPFGISIGLSVTLALVYQFVFKKRMNANDGKEDGAG